MPVPKIYWPSAKECRLDEISMMYLPGHTKVTLPVADTPQPLTALLLPVWISRL